MSILRISYVVVSIHFFRTVSVMHNAVVPKQVKRTKGPTPAPSDHPARPSFDIAKEALREELRKPPENHEAAKAQVSLFIGEFSCLKVKPNRHSKEIDIDVPLQGRLTRRVIGLILWQ